MLPKIGMWATLFRGQGSAFFLTKNGFGYILGYFFLKVIWSPWPWITFHNTHRCHGRNTTVSVPCDNARVSIL
jgi:hypothetical protein